jgi:hypothetical protein
MWHWLVEMLRHHPEMTLFLVRALGGPGDQPGESGRLAANRATLQVG